MGFLSVPCPKSGGELQEKLRELLKAEGFRFKNNK